MLVPAVAAMIGLLGASPWPVSAVAPTRADPTATVHAQDDSSHRGEQLNFTPATTSPGPLLNRTRPRGAPARPGGAPVVSREVLGFAPYWALSASGSWNYDLMTTVAYFGLSLKGDGSFDNTDSGWSGLNSQQLVNLIDSAHRSGDRVVLVVKCFDAGTVNQLVTNPGARQTAIANTLSAVRAKNLDGVNVDLEGTSAGYPGVQAGVNSFMTELGGAVHQWRSSAFLTIDTYSGSASWDGGIFNIRSLAPLVDAIFVMAYDMIFSDLPNHAGPGAPLRPYPPYNDTDAVSQYLSRAPASKVILGVPYYGYKWSTASSQPNAATLSGARAETYSNAVADLRCAQTNNLNFSQHWDAVAASPWISWYSPASADPCGGNYGSWRELYYEDALSLGFKYDLVNANDLLGTGMWALGYDGGAPELWNELSIKFAPVPSWSTLGGTLTSGPGVSSWSANREDLFARGTDAQLWHNWQDSRGWHVWEPLGGVLAAGTGPAAVSWAANRIDVFVKGIDGQSWHKWWDGQWSGWEPLGGALAATPAVASRWAGGLDLFVRGTDNVLWHRWWTGRQWSAWEYQGGVLTSAAGADSRGRGELDVFVRGTDGGLWHKWWDGARWNGYEPLGGSLTSAPAAASWGPGRIDVVALGQTGELLHLYWLGQWSVWLSRAGTGTSDPALASPSNGVIDAFVRGTDNAAWRTGVPP
jgi:Glycosyl hydrolases family 18/Repeat of unknown function (DUF346)